MNYDPLLLIGWSILKVFGGTCQASYLSLLLTPILTTATIIKGPHPYRAVYKIGGQVSKGRKVRRPSDQVLNYKVERKVVCPRISLIWTIAYRNIYFHIMCQYRFKIGKKNYCPIIHYGARWRKEWMLKHFWNFRTENRENKFETETDNHFYSWYFI